jgi:exopolysaccharide biosynthesis WecB/TagA/CpsF family protein
VRDQQIVLLANNDWAQDFGSGRVTSKAHLVRHLARENDVLYVESVGLRSPTASARHLRKIAGKLRRFTAGLRQEGARIWVGNPLILPWAPERTRLLNTAALQLWLAWALARLGWRRPILWHFHPTMHRYLAALPRRLEIYSCVDDHAAFAGVDSAYVRRWEERLIRRADLVLTTAESLYQRCRALTPRAERFPHGVDVEHFSAALGTPVLPADIEAIPPPRIGYVGLLSRDYVDLELIRRTALLLPEFSFVLIGDQYAEELAPLRDVRNVHLVGPRPYAELPRCLAGMAACLIPYRLNEINRSCNPLKLREYLAAGRPVVATPLEEIRGYAPHVRLAATPEEFAAALREAVAEDHPEAARARAAHVAGESWGARFAWLDRRLDELLRPGARRGPAEEALNPHERCLLFGIPFHNTTMEGAVRAVDRLIERGKAAQIVTVNVDGLVKARKLPDYLATIRSSPLILADGMPVVWASKLVSTGLKQKVSGSDLIGELAAYAAAKGIPIFLLGGAPGIAARAGEELRRRFPGLSVAGCLSPPFRELTEEEEAELARTIRESGARLLLVALGAPKQERWIARNLPRLGPVVCLGVGAGLDFIAGAQPRAPAWFQDHGLEWLYRLARDPRRLARRYLVEDSRFLLWVLRELAANWWRWTLFRA